MLSEITPEMEEGSAAFLKKDGRKRACQIVGPHSPAEPKGESTIMKTYSYRYAPALAVAALGMILGACQQAPAPAPAASAPPATTSSSVEHTATTSSTTTTPGPADSTAPPSQTTTTQTTTEQKQKTQ
jgi:hypothetical protein